MSSEPKSVTFEGVVSGDGECFVWDEVSDVDFDRLVPPDMRDFIGPGRLYPNTIVQALGIEPGDTARYRFTITAEKVAEETP